MVATQVLETCDFCRVGSSPTWGTKKKYLKYEIFLYLCSVIDENDSDTQVQLHMG